MTIDEQFKELEDKAQKLDDALEAALEYIRALERQLAEARRIAEDNWSIVETVACGETLECVICGKPRPCRCQDTSVDIPKKQAHDS